MTFRYSLIETSLPAEEPVALAELKSFLRITHNSEDAVLTGMMTAARLFCENYTGKSFVTRGFKVIFDRLGKTECIPIPKMPVVSVSAVKTGDGQLIDAGNYTTDTAAGRLCLKETTALQLPARDYNLLEIEFTAGFGAAADVPESIKQAILMKAVQLYEERGDVPFSAPFDMIASLLKPYKKIGLA